MIPAMPPTLIALVLVSALLVLIPTRRLHLAGWSQSVVGAYFLAMWLATVALAWAPGATRFLVPILVAAYLAPFVTLRAGVDRLLGRRRLPGPPPRNVTPRNGGRDGGAD